MTCHYCHTACKRFGKHRNGIHRFRCNQCSKTFTEDHTAPLNDMRLPLDKAVGSLKLLVEDMSVRSVERVTGVHRDTILSLFVLAGERCEKLLAETITYLQVRDVECDEMWGYVGMKERAKSYAQKDTPELGVAQLRSLYARLMFISKLKEKLVEQ